MKYIKLFELKNESKFKKGDFVYAIDTEGTSHLEENTKYEIEEVFPDGEYYNSTTYKVIGIPGGQYYEDRFISEEEWKVRNDANKYNL